MNKLTMYGLTEQFTQEARLYEDLALARVISQYQGMYKVATAMGERMAEVSGKFRYAVTDRAEYPAVGDFVMVDHESQASDIVRIHHILTRKSLLLRRAVGVSHQAQVIASNLDYLFIAMSLNENYNLNRLERYLTVGWDSGATPVIVLTKADLSNRVEEALGEVEAMSFYSDVIVTSSKEDNREKFHPYLTTGKTAAFIGSSGVGKTTLINMLLRDRRLETKAVGKEAKGRHTTTSRDSYPTIFGGVVIDTPGMRELGIDQADLATSFQDIDMLSKMCKFKDCSHTNEPGCAVQQAIQSGELDERRLDSYVKLKHEADYAGLTSKAIEQKKTERMFKDVGGMKQARKFAKQKRKQ
ncbi:putative ribosome biogenesis GTPase RsgA 2 [Halolactibacillus miurensis]|uniref:Small ribosomal subunit biogenesis GTPase RsgA n=1 Tax=Halolactibacillus miurensis TaxID=306541 RepID=A0A1I6TYQ2_9BACI|nr:MULTISPECIES: ribosome small subunit-dependent GTPase A [Halolactibacillus]GEM04854.1 putative ribosome biogenesis GTPase RsgA 2 [Halolactibacillus miurensis]SFS94305.1 ribosome biogenesis GTPase [Halolactibacillus miurensis]